MAGVRNPAPDGLDSCHDCDGNKGMTAVKIAAIQMNSGEDVAANLTRARRALRSAAADGAVLAVLPENFARMGKRESDRLAIVEDNNVGPLQDFLAAEAARASCASSR